MKLTTLLILSILCTSCQITENSNVTSGNLTTSISADIICSGHTVHGIVGTADCSGSGGIEFLSFASRKDNASFPVTPAEFATFLSSPNRAVATLQDEQEENSTFSANHSVIPSPLDDTDGYQAIVLSAQELIDLGRTNDIPLKKHYLETIAKNGPITSRADIVACGSVGTIEERIADCNSKNGLWSYYDGKKYGQDVEGDWKQVSVLIAAGPIIYEVWRDERTKLLWSDQSSTINTTTGIPYSWYHIAGYSKDTITSSIETGGDASPGVGQDVNPISLCADVIAGAIAGGGGTPGYTYSNPETDFKGGLSYPEVRWRMPSRNDWYLAEVNGISKVLPNLEFVQILTATSYTMNRTEVWDFNLPYGTSNSVPRGTVFTNIRCVGSANN